MEDEINNIDELLQRKLNHNFAKGQWGFVRRIVRKVRRVVKKGRGYASKVCNICNSYVCKFAG
jgi:hypothetical protein